MPKAIVELICEECQSPFSKSKSEHQRTVKRGYRQFCSRPCGHEYKRKNGEAFVSHLEKWRNSDENKTHIQKLQKERVSRAEPFKEFLRRARKSVVSKGRELDLTIEQLKTIWENQDGICPYTGWKLEVPKHHCLKKPNTASLDRINSALGYVFGNVQFVSVMANFAKSDFSDEDMRKFCQAIKIHTPAT